jgi:hypothetical protein
MRQQIEAGLLVEVHLLLLLRGAKAASASAADAEGVPPADARSRLVAARRYAAEWTRTNRPAGGADLSLISPHLNQQINGWGWRARCALHPARHDVSARRHAVLGLAALDLWSSPARHGMPISVF